MQPTVSEPQLPSFDDEVVTTAEIDDELPEIEDEIKQRWEHEKLITGMMTASFTETAQGRPQLEVTIMCNGTKQMFWSRIGLASSNWSLSRHVLPYVNTIRTLKGQDLYPFGTELNQSTLTKYLESAWVKKQMAKPLEVRVITRVKDAFDQRGNKKREVSCEFIHLNDDGSEEVFKTLKAIRDQAGVASATAVNQAIAQQTPSRQTSSSVDPNSLM